MRVVIEEETLDDLDEIHEWIAADDPPAADSAVERIFDAIDRLEAFRSSAIKAERATP